MMLPCEGGGANESVAGMAISMVRAGSEDAKNFAQSKHFSVIRVKAGQRDWAEEVYGGGQANARAVRVHVW